MTPRTRVIRNTYRKRRKSRPARLRVHISSRRASVESLEARTLLSAAPVVSTEAATSVSGTGATLHGTVNAEGGTATAAFQYSTSPAFTPTVETTVASGFDLSEYVAVDSSGDVFVSDVGNQAVKEVSPDGSVKTVISGSGYSKPAGVAVDASGDVFVADSYNGEVYELSPGGKFQTVATGFSRPEGVAVDASGDVFIVDSFYGTVNEVLPGGSIQTVASGFSSPDGVAVDAHGDVFVADAGNNAIKKVLPNGSIQAIGSGFLSPHGVAVDASGDVFVTDASDSVVKEVLSNGTIETIGASFDGMWGLAVDASGDVFVADRGNVINTGKVVELSPPTVSASPSPVSGSIVTAVSATLTGLTPGTVYYYRAEATDGGTVVDAQSPPASFTTAAAPFKLNEDIYVVGSGTVNVSAADGVLTNDAGAGALTVTSGTVAGAEGGTFTFHADGSFIYTPPANFPGFDYAQYTASDGQGDTAKATVNVLSQTGGVVWKFYESVLNRDPDPGGLTYWINDFVNGGKTGDIAAGFFESDELLNEIITGYYQQYLHRAPDASGLAHWRQVWHATGGPEIIKAGFADSPEFYASAEGTPDAWITQLYLRILNRQPDQQGKQYWLDYLTSQGNTAEARKHIALGFFTSLEAYKGDVTEWFQEYLQRAPSDSELNHFASEMQAGKTDRDIEQEITNLSEYGQYPPASPPGEGVRMPDYFPQTTSSATPPQAAIATKDSLFAKVGA